MKNKKPKIFYINSKADIQKGSSLTDMLDEINGLLMEKKYKEALDKSKIAKHSYPNNPFCHISEALSYSMLDEKQEAAEILENAAEKFPGNFEILYQLGGIYNDLGEYEAALYAVEDSLEFTPEQNIEARSECFNELGVIYWNMHLKEEAIEQWKSAIMENPENIQAQMNLRDFTNEYGEPASISKEMDDIFHFQNLQIEKYLKKKGQDDFKDQKQADKVINHIINKWNEEIAPQKDRLDKSSPEEKTEWFKAVKIDYRKKVKNLNLPKFSSSKIPARFSEFDGLDRAMIPFTLLLISAAGIPITRVEELFYKDLEFIGNELELIEWALDIVNIILLAIDDRTSADKSDILMEEAIQTAEEELDPEYAERAIYKTAESIAEFLEKEEKKSRKS